MFGDISRSISPFLLLSLLLTMIGVHVLEQVVAPEIT